MVSDLTTSVANGRRFGVILYSFAVVVYDAVKSRPQGHAREALPSLARRFVLGSGLSPARKARAPMHMVSGALASLGLVHGGGGGVGTWGTLGKLREPWGLRGVCGNLGLHTSLEPLNPKP